MARILMSCVPAYGLANPTFPFARALVAAGHHVDYLIPSSFRRAVERTGATHLPYADYLDGPIVRPDQLVRHGRRLFRDQDAELLARGRDYDAVVAGGMNPRIPELEHALDRPVIFLSPVFFQHDQVIRHLAGLADALPAPARRLFADRRLRRPVMGVVGAAMGWGRDFDVVAMMGPRSSTLNISPASRYYQPCDHLFGDRCLFAGPTPTLAASDDSFPIDRLRDHDGPVIYGTLGTVFNSWTPFFRTLAAAFAGSNALLVLTTGNARRLREVGPMPANVVISDFVPQTEVLRHADLCFTHGGFGSATDTVAMGVPAIFTPMGADQFFNAYRIQELDAGRVLPKRDFTPANARRLADEVLQTPPAGLPRLRRSFLDAPGPAAAVTAIEEVIAGRSPTLP